jgi:Protein of unknown function (DUF2752)
MQGARAILLAAVVASRLMSRRLLDADPPVCVFRQVTGRPCPACGLTRSWSAAARLDVAESAAWHPLGIPALVGALMVASGAVTPDLADARTRRWAAAGAAMWLGVWFLRFARPPARLRR